MSNINNHDNVPLLDARAEILNLKRENLRLNEILDIYFRSVKEQEIEIHELLADKKRLDWLLNTAYAIQLNPKEVDIVSSREAIDKLMKNRPVFSTDEKNYPVFLTK